MRLLMISYGGHVQESFLDTRRSPELTAAGSAHQRLPAYREQRTTVWLAATTVFFQRSYGGLIT